MSAGDKNGRRTCVATSHGAIFLRRCRGRQLGVHTVAFADAVAHIESMTYVLRHTRPEPNIKGPLLNRS